MVTGRLKVTTILTSKAKVCMGPKQRGRTKGMFHLEEQNYSIQGWRAWTPTSESGRKQLTEFKTQVGWWGLRAGSCGQCRARWPLKQHGQCPHKKREEATTTDRKSADRTRTGTRGTASSPGEPRTASPHLKVGISQEGLYPESQRSHGPADAYMWTAGFQNCEPVDFHCLKPPKTTRTANDGEWSASFPDFGV